MRANQLDRSDDRVEKIAAQPDRRISYHRTAAASSSAAGSLN
jgi:hypothetical protein